MANAYRCRTCNGSGVEHIEGRNDDNTVVPLDLKCLVCDGSGIVRRRSEGLTWGENVAAINRASMESTTVGAPHAPAITQGTAC